MTDTFETIKIEDGVAQNIKYHQDRLERTIYKLYGKRSNISLASVIEPKEQNIQRCKIIYNREITSIQYSSYSPKIVKNLKIINANIDYEYKYCDRSKFENLSNQHKEFDDIIISQNGLLTDTTIANIAFLENSQWITPKTPLLYGTTRARLIDDGFLIEKDIRPSDISNFNGFAIMNAMIGFYEVNGYNIDNDLKDIHER